MSRPLNHIALILDGNRRWAKKQGLGVLKGHQSGADRVESLLDRLDELGVHTVTLWGFSTENWTRDQLQVQGLMKLFEDFIDTFKDKAIRKESRVIHLGRKDRLPASLVKKIADIEQETAHLTRRVINMALDYGGRDEIIRAVKRLEEQGVSAKTLTEENFNQFLDTMAEPFPEPDMIVRTGGEMRMSGFMAWQGVYAEYYFIDTLFPDLTPNDMDDIVAEYGRRERRFGGGK
ncbi:di-trans,poly-cis-decaprenylcistransferase [Candidatus Woesebacteria bacterium]|nr:di-trans,poly-cis-decaprenylcistransferase [Candidatus Woesebacteria bacterium]